jgi:hypothetical protein
MMFVFFALFKKVEKDVEDIERCKVFSAEKRISRSLRLGTFHFRAIFIDTLNQSLPFPKLTWETLG